MELNFNYPIITAQEGYPATRLGRDNTDTWNVISYYVEEADDDTETGWAQIEVNNLGVSRADIEDEVEDPEPFIIQATTETEVTIGVYEGLSIVADFSNPESLPFGELGRIALTYSTRAGKVVSATVTSILPSRT
jgi:hypothetical protein